MDLEKMTEEQLKALAYDQLVILQNTQANLEAINAQIAKLKEPKEEPKKDK